MRASGALIIGAFFLAGLQPDNYVFGQGATSTLTVCAKVLPLLKISTYQHVAQYQVTDHDLKRGYVDLPGSATVRVKTNENKSIGVTVLNEGPEKILVKESGTNNFSDSDGTLKIGQVKRGTETTRILDFRLILPQGVREGTYSLSIALNPYLY